MAIMIPAKDVKRYCGCGRRHAKCVVLLKGGVYPLDMLCYR